MEVVLDSPMAVDVTGLYGAHPSELDPELVRAPGFPESLFPRRLRFARSVDESKALRGLTSPALVLSASGMCTGGRVLHHLSQRLEDPRNAVCIVGFMPIGTLGRQLLDGAEEVRIHGRHVAVEAEIVKINALSAHADRVELGRWLDSFATPPARTFVVHGEPPASAALAADVAARGWAVEVAAFGQIAEV
jgi:metallo-beta-lactamase family protein